MRRVFVQSAAHHLLDAQALTLRLRGLTRPRADGAPTFALHLTTLEGTEREPTQARWDVDVDEVELTEGGDAWLRAESLWPTPP